MAIVNATRVQLQNEGIMRVEDLAEFTKEDLDAVAHNLHHPAARVGPFIFGAKSQKRLTVMAELVRYYDTIGRDLSAGNMQWNTVGKHFEIQWNALKKKKEDDIPETPKMAKQLAPMKWCESFMDHLHRCVGVRTVPLAYVLREKVVVPAVCLPITAREPHSEATRSIKQELIERTSHDHPLYRNDNETIYHKMEEATRGTSYTASITPFQRHKDGRGAFMAIKSQHAGDDKWMAEVTKQDAFLHNQKWRSNGSMKLERHCSLHRTAYVQMVAASSHINYQTPNEHTRIGFLLDSIESTDAELHAAMASIKQDKTPNGLRSNFEDAVATLLPADPVAKKQTSSGDKRKNVDVSSVDVEIGATHMRSGKGKTGVDFRWHTVPEFKDLNKAQKDELTA